MRLLRLTKSRKKCPLLQLGWGSFPGGLCFKSPVKGPAAKPLSPPRRTAPCRATPRCAGHSPSRFGTGAGGRGGAPGAQVVLPLLQAAPPGVHEEVADGGELQAQLLGDGDLHFFGRALVLLEDGEKRSALEVRENQARFLLGIVPLFVRLLLFAFAGWGRGGQRQREIKRQDARGCPQTPPATRSIGCELSPPCRSRRTGGAGLPAEPAPVPACRTRGLMEESPGGYAGVRARAAKTFAFSEMMLDGHLAGGRSGTELLGNRRAPPDHPQTRPSSSLAISGQWPTFEILRAFYKATV